MGQGVDDRSEDEEGFPDSAEELRPRGLRIKDQMESLIALEAMVSEMRKADPSVFAAWDDRIDWTLIEKSAASARGLLSGTMAKLSTDYGRWFMQARMPAPWDARNSFIVEQIGDAKHIWDIGAGSQSIGKMLPEDCVYTAIDCVPAIPGTFVCDFNVEFLLPNKPCDLIIMSGFLEYVMDMRGFFVNMRKHRAGTQIMFSWLTSMTAGKSRVFKGWINPLRFEDEGVAFFSEHVDGLELVGKPMGHNLYRGVLRPAETDA